eukprot:Skav232788  [mRNA]  locus=scaffold614:208081:216164:- [translate_table: standard]
MIMFSGKSSCPVSVQDAAYREGESSAEDKRQQTGSKVDCSAEIRSEEPITNSRSGAGPRHSSAFANVKLQSPVAGESAGILGEQRGPSLASLFSSLDVKAIAPTCTLLVALRGIAAQISAGFVVRCQGQELESVAQAERSRALEAEDLEDRKWSRNDIVLRRSSNDKALQIPDLQHVEMPHAFGLGEPPSEDEVADSLQEVAAALASRV